MNNEKKEKGSPGEYEYIVAGDIFHLEKMMNEMVARDGRLKPDGNFFFYTDAGGDWFTQRMIVTGVSNDSIATLGLLLKAVQALVKWQHMLMAIIVSDENMLDYHQNDFNEAMNGEDIKEYIDE